MIRDRIEALVRSWTGDNGDEPDTEYQHGYMAACEEHARELAAILQALRASRPEPAADAVEAVKRAILTAEWSGGYDRNGSHAAGGYVEYREGLLHLFDAPMAEAWADELARAALSALPRPEADDGVADTALLDALEGRRWVIYPGLDEGWSVVEVCATSDPAGPEENEVATTTGSVRDALRAALAAAQEGAR